MQQKEYMVVSMLFIPLPESVFRLPRRHRKRRRRRAIFLTAVSNFWWCAKVWLYLQRYDIGASRTARRSLHPHNSNILTYNEKVLL